MSITKQMERISELVHELLVNDPKYRDSDRKLCCKIWSIEMGGSITATQNISMYDFLCEYSKPNAESRLTSVASIERVRRKLQEDNPHLRGKNYKGKQDEQVAVTGFLGYR